MQSIFDLIGFGPTGWGPALLKGLLITLQISVGAFLVGLLIGLAAASVKISGPRPLAMLARGYTTLCRAVPELLLILLLFYVGSMGLNQFFEWLGYGQVKLNGMMVAIVVLGLVQGAYASEIFRGAIQSIPYGQIEAARAYGMHGFGLFRRVTLPMMAPNALAGMANLWVNLIKDSALISVVGYSELLGAGRQAAASTKHYLMFYLVVAAFYYVITLCSGLVFRRIEARFERWMPRLA